MNLKNIRTEFLKLSSFKPMLFFFGAYIFSYCLYILIHETGHLIAFLIFGWNDAKISVTPFSGYTYKETYYFHSDIEKFLIFLAGPLFSLLCATIVFILFWHKRNPYLLPLFMYSSTVYLSEGIIIMNSLLDDTAIISDFDWLMALGLSPFIVAIISGVVLTIGFVITYLFWPLVEISPSDSFLRKLFINSGFIIYLILIVIFLPLFTPIVRTETKIFLNFIYLWYILFFLLRIALYRPVFPFIDRLTHTDVIEVSWFHVKYSLGLGSGIFIFLLFFFN